MTYKQEALEVLKREIKRSWKELREAIRKLGVPAAILVLAAIPLLAQSGSTATFTWSGNTESSQFATINGIATNASIGYAGYISISYGQYLAQFDLPEAGRCPEATNPDGSCPVTRFPAFPNNGFLSGYCSQITWGANQWGTRADGTPMDGTKAGDSYTKTGTTRCTAWNGSVSVSITELREIMSERACIRAWRGNCTQYGYKLFDVIQNGSGSATVE